MEAPIDTASGEILVLTAQIVSAHVSKNPVPAGEVPGLIKSVHASLTSLGNGEPATPQTPAVPVKKSVTPEFIFCLEDGKKLKMLKRYIRTKFGLSPDEYRARWGLPADYPMVCASYAAQRSDFAKKIGLGRNAPARGNRKAP